MRTKEGSMPHTESRYMQSLGFNDGRIFCGPGDAIAVGSVAAPVVVRNAAGDWVLQRTAAGAETINITINMTQQLLRRTGFFEDLQELFGGTGIAGSAAPQGRPDTIGAMNTGQWITPRTAFKLKGVKFLSIDAIYRVTVVNLTTNTIRMDQTLLANNVAPAITPVLAPLGIPTVVQANPYVSITPLPVAQQIYRITPDQELWVEMTAVMANTGVLAFYGFDVQMEFNFN
jgi:hypothetical protein